MCGWKPPEFDMLEDASCLIAHSLDLFSYDLESISSPRFVILISDSNLLIFESYLSSIYSPSLSLFTKSNSLDAYRSYVFLLFISLDVSISDSSTFVTFTCFSKSSNLPSLFNFSRSISYWLRVILLKYVKSRISMRFLFMKDVNHSEAALW